MIRLGPAFSAVALVSLLGACGGGSSGSAGRTVEVTITDRGCDPASLTVAKGSTTFHVKNDGADSITEFEVLDPGGTIVGEKENLTPGLDGRFTIDLANGEYTLACPGGTEHPTGKLTVTDTGAAAEGSSAGKTTDCVPSGSSDAPTAHLKATLSDFKIELDPASVAAGAIAIDGTNAATRPHEVVVVKGVAPTALPTSSDGGVDEDQLSNDAVIGELEAFSGGRSCSATFALPSGTYTLFCNVVAEEGSHYRLGMVTTLTVT